MRTLLRCKGLRSMRRSQCPVHTVKEHCEGVNGTSTAHTEPQTYVLQGNSCMGPAVLHTEQKHHVFAYSYYCIGAHQSMNQQRLCDWPCGVYTAHHQEVLLYSWWILMLCSWKVSFLSVLHFIVRKQWIMLIQMNCIQFNSRYLGSLH
jgi:hypothetical protein